MDTQQHFSNEQYTALPSYQHVDFEKLHVNALYNNIINDFIWFAIIAAVYGASWFFQGDKISVVAPYFYVGFPIYMVVHLVWEVLGYRGKGFAVREHDILYRRGVFWQVTTVLPFTRIQHNEIHQGPIQRLMNLATLRLYSAGGMSADLAIEGLTHEQAMSLRDVIQRFHQGSESA